MVEKIIKRNKKYLNNCENAAHCLGVGLHAMPQGVAAHAPSGPRGWRWAGRSNQAGGEIAGGTRPGQSPASKQPSHCIP